MTPCMYLYGCVALAVEPGTLCSVHGRKYDRVNADAYLAWVNMEPLEPRPAVIPRPWDKLHWTEQRPRTKGV